MSNKDDLPKGISANWNWKPNDQSHPGAADWFRVMAEQLKDVNQHQAQLECELAYLDLVDFLIEDMTSFPDVDALLANIR